MLLVKLKMIDVVSLKITNTMKIFMNKYNHKLGYNIYTKNCTITLGNK